MKIILNMHIIFATLFIAPLVCSAQPNNDVIVFLHPFRLNPEYIEKYRILLPQGLNECAPTGPDAIDAITLRTANKRVYESPNWFKKSIAQFQLSRLLSEAGSKGALAQEGDICTVLSHIKEHNFSAHRKLLIGDSKGAALTLNLLGSGLLENIGGIVAISPFYHTNIALQDFHGIPHHWIINNYILPIAYYWYLPRVVPSGIQPCKSISNIARYASQTPILIVAIMNDTLVPAYQQLALYVRLKELGCNVYLLMVEDALHAKIARCSTIDVVSSVILSFWRDICHVDKKHFNKTIASIADDPRYQPSAQEIRTLMTGRYHTSPEKLDAEIIGSC